MKRYLFVIIFSFALTVPTLVQACELDPRFVNTDKLLENPQGDALQITPRFFLSLDQDTRAALSNRLQICDSQLGTVSVVNGVPKKKVNAEFYDLYYQLVYSILEKDNPTVDLILKHFKAAPMDNASAFDLLARTGLEPKVAKALGKNMDITLHEPNHFRSKPESRTCKKLEPGERIDFSLIEAFVRLGGAIKTPGERIYAGLNSATSKRAKLVAYWHLEADKVFKPVVQKHKGQECYALDYRRNLEALKKLGFNVEIGKRIKEKNMSAFRNQALGINPEVEKNTDFFD